MIDDTTTDARTDTSSDSESDEEVVDIRRPTDVTGPTPAAQPTTTVVVATTTTEVVAIRTEPGADHGATSPKGDSRVKSWLMDKFSRRASRGRKSEENMAEHGHKGKEGFIGGASLVQADASLGNADVRDFSAPETGTAKEVVEPEIASGNISPPTPAAAVPLSVAEPEDDSRLARSRQRDGSPAISPLSDDRQKDYLGGDMGEDRDKVGQSLKPPVLSGAQRTSDSPVRDSKFMENL